MPALTPMTATLIARSEPPGAREAGTAGERGEEA